MKKYTLLSLALITFGLFSCGNSANKSAEYGLAAQEEVVLEDINENGALQNADLSKNETNTNAPASASPVLQNKKIVRSGSITLESKDIAKTKQHIDKLIQDADGYYEQENSSSGSTYTAYTLNIRIPATKFDSFIQSIADGKDKITEKSIQAKDVSLQYLDVQSRLKSKNAYLLRYQQMVASAKTTKDLLEIEEQIRQLQEDIESNTTILRSLADQVNYSTLSIQIYYAESGNINQPNTFLHEVGESMKSGWDLIKSSTLILLSLWPFIILSIIAVIGWRKYKRRKINKKELNK